MAPGQVNVDPATLTQAQRDEAGIAVLTSNHLQTINTLDESSLLRSILGNEVVDAVVAVRRYEHDHYGDLEPEQLTERFRLAWSV